jgi:hypothetical protein
MVWPAQYRRQRQRRDNEATTLLGSSPKIPMPASVSAGRTPGRDPRAIDRFGVLDIIRSVSSAKSC